VARLEWVRRGLFDGFLCYVQEVLLEKRKKAKEKKEREKEEALRTQLSDSISPSGRSGRRRRMRRVCPGTREFGRFVNACSTFSKAVMLGEFNVSIGLSC